MTQPHRPSKYHKVTLPTRDADAAPPAPAARFGYYGPWYVTGYVFCFSEPGQLAQPGDNRFNVDLSRLLIGTPVAVSADVSELINSYYPHIGDAVFLTKGVMLNQPDRFATVLFSMRWNSPLPVAITMNVGFMAHPELPGYRPSPRYAVAADLLQCARHLVRPRWGRGRHMATPRWPLLASSRFIMASRRMRQPARDHNGSYTALLAACRMFRAAGDARVA